MDAQYAFHMVYKDDLYDPMVENREKFLKAALA